MDATETGTITLRPFSGHVEAFDVEALADEFRKYFPVVRVEPFPPNIGGPLEAFFEIAIDGGKQVLIAYLANLAAEKINTIRPALWAALTRKNAKQPPDMYGLSVRSGDFRMYVRKSLSDRGDMQRFEAARKYAESLPSEVFDAGSGSGNPGIYWDEEGQEWKPAPKHEIYGEFCPADAG